MSVTYLKKYTVFQVILIGLLITAFICLSSIVAQADKGETDEVVLKPGDPMPQITSFDVERVIFESKKIVAADKFLIVSFFTTYCEPCIAEFPEFKKMKTEMGDKLEVLLISVGQDSRDELKRFREQHNIPDFRIVRDKYSSVRKPFGVSDKVPVTFLFDPKGKVLYAQYGAFTDGKVYDVLMPLIKELKNDNIEE
ncbi:MAG: TlpA disulfide reductase family protein [Candidatus Hatepunaea meridiana]|nr:TlpA disulfide reductase family protein [Candidatus Hatepunaea meridiana]